MQEITFCFSTHRETVQFIYGVEGSTWKATQALMLTVCVSRHTVICPMRSATIYDSCTG